MGRASIYDGGCKPASHLSDAQHLSGSKIIFNFCPHKQALFKSSVISIAAAALLSLLGITLRRVVSSA